MIFTTGTGSVCSGGSHFELPVTINSVQRTLKVTRQELIDAAPDGFEEGRDAIVKRLRSAILEATTGVPTNAQIGTAVNNKTFEV